MGHEVIISDGENTLINRQEIQNKLDRLEIYVTRVGLRLKQLSRQLTRIHDHSDKEVLVRQGLEMLDLKPRHEGVV